MITNFKSVLIIFILMSSVFLGVDCKRDPVTPIIPPESDSTSHEIFWRFDTIGTWQSNFVDAWGTASNNVYAVGFIYDPDSTTPGTNVMHWDGYQWKPENFWEGDMFAIWGFSANDIWVGGHNGAEAIIGHWDGSQWKKIIPGFINHINGLWGSSPDNIFAVCSGGAILQYDGSTWKQVISNTNIYLADIWGYSENEIYACGYEDSGRGVLLHYNGVQWEVIYDRLFNAQDSISIPKGKTTAVWGIDTSKVYIWTPAGSFLGSRNTWEKIDVPNDNTYVTNIDGTSAKNIFMIGHFSLIIHWNGKNWHRYNDLYRIPNGDELYGLCVFEDHVFIVGRSETARGIVYRGTINN